MPPSFQLCGHAGTLQFGFDGYERTAADNSSDANWLTCHISLTVSTCSAEVTTSLTTQEIRALRDELATAVRTLTGAVDLATEEDALQLGIQVLRSGTARVKGVLRIRSTSRVSVHFEFETDQSYLQETLEGVNAVVNAFPVVRMG